LVRIITTKGKKMSKFISSLAVVCMISVMSGCLVKSVAQGEIYPRGGFDVEVTWGRS